MPVRVTSDDWTSERVKAFWDHCYRQKNRAQTFSERVSRGVVRYLRVNGLLRGEVLDYGCGPGALAAQLIRAGCQCWGCDWSEASVEAANRLLTGRRGWHGASLAGDPRSAYCNREFDLVTCLETIEHIPEHEEEVFFANLRRVVKMGGSLFLTTPNEEDLSLDHKNVYCPFCDSLYHQRQHVRSFDKNTLTATIERHGFAVRWVTALDFNAYQVPAWPGIGEVNLRYLARVAVRMPFSPITAVHRRSRGKLPHLCAVAAKVPEL
ncbi:class I SAM-dependent methyltransferase [Microbispora rosea]|uniref:class I SAM-dependent methyltransferase n=1 Tax=Microbispora rosea TaxID=58117 RepID=UPI00341EE505